MGTTPQRHHWLNTYVGVLDSAFHLTDEEQYAVTDIVKKLLVQLRIPERGEPAVVPVPVAQENHFGLYSLQMDSRRKSPLPPGARRNTHEDLFVSLEAWRDALVDMATAAYPGLSVEERLLLTKVVTDLLAAIGVPNRAVAHHPPSVIAAHREIDPVA